MADGCEISWFWEPSIGRISNIAWVGWHGEEVRFERQEFDDHLRPILIFMDSLCERDLDSGYGIYNCIVDGGMTSGFLSCSLLRCSLS